MFDILGYWQYNVKNRNFIDAVNAEVGINMEIKENFSGYVNYESKQFFCVVNNYIVKLFPHMNGDLAALDSNKPINDRWLFGFDEDNYEMALLMRGGFKRSILGHYTWFGSPIIIKSTANAVQYGLESFDAISFSGGIINSVYNPKIAVKSASYDQAVHNGARNIEIKPFDAYSHSYPIFIDGETANIVYSISQDGKAEDVSTCELGALTSFIRIEFERSQSIDKFIRYYDVIKRFISFLVGQHNITFETTLRKRNKDGLFYEIAICKISDGYSNYCKKSFYRVIPLNAFKERISSAVLLFAGDQKPFLEFLPNDNRDSNRVSYTNVEDICTSLEIEYGLKGYTLQVDNTTEGLKRAIVEAIRKFKETDSHPSEKLYDKAYGSVKNLSISNAEKIWRLYDRYKPLMYKIFEADDPFTYKLTEKSVRNFVQLRNQITHSGVIAWEENAKVYRQLEALVYFAVFERIGIPAEEAYGVIHQLM